MDEIVLFQNACYKGNLYTAKFLLFIRPHLKNSINFQRVFSIVCNRGKLNIAKWLLELKPDINISANNEYTFACSCRSGHLLIVQWLLKIKPDIDISANHDYAFYYSCRDGYLDVAQWLQSLKPHLYKIEYNDDGSYKGYYIRCKEEERWARRKQLVWLASNESPCKKNLFYRLPQDVSRYIISNYL